MISYSKRAAAAARGRPGGRRSQVRHAFLFHCNSSIIFRLSYALEAYFEMVRSRLRAWKLVLLALVLAPLIALLALGLWPVSADFAGDEGTAGVDSRASGLKKPFPSMVVPAANPMSSDLRSDPRTALGHLLFFRSDCLGGQHIILRCLSSPRSWSFRWAGPLDG